MITLHQFLPAQKGPDPSPFCAKVDTFLKISGLPHEVRVGSPMKAPKGKLPFIKDGERVVADSDDIIKYLSNTYRIDLDKNLTPQQKAISFAVRKMLEEYLYFIVLHKRWVEDSGWAVVKPMFFNQVPFPIRGFVSGMVRGQVKKSAYAQGIGRHSNEEIDKRAGEVIVAIAELLPKEGYFFGSEPSLIDCVIFPFLHNCLYHPVDSEMKRVAESFPHLRRYDAMMVKKLYG